MILDNLLHAWAQTFFGPRQVVVAMAWRLAFLDR